ncbi:peptide ABC transporter ATPase [Thermotoga maritima MSB8]|uniref:Oligopeptide ABC transporter, ATP-binding protein n=1 Tax=Thermotoga maritima (strain ATCC 43589 / DSM 3109 / JCM 10099 / NBRC 100826 / MSB8) TaxID=243274 RepID=Q9WXN5_THEMA|nr:ABC transporter ATP-binding protein [Thermotoga maritima]AAD35122.1 oligopeptide ABC transporter, ATP-binding protein [Thermotoga maritima MSB8]AGL48951.1 Beta-glucoside ABC transport system, ATP-binding protein 1 [Thermotoga maritima MSB8]AHD18201.1 peptide ABC transporter ATPase [Thermotoga maritima MSB8]AKE25975.1 peptide ABC transporter ATPase [Thermotoga maritima]AKE27837.1 peptide ABC transporter ATPase [Thermotoga maritima MSB8]
MKEILLKAENVRAYYKLEKVSVKAVDGLSFEILEDEVIGVVGESGCGKTTLSNVIFMNMVKPLTLVDGKIFLRVNGEFVELSSMTRDEVKRKFWGKEITIIPQAAMNALMPTIRMEKYVRHLAESHGIDEEELLDKARRRFEEVGLDPLWIKRYPFELSGGMRQRAVIAIATILNPSLLIADEPTSALDVVNQKVLLKVLMQMKRQGIVKSIIFITHDIATVRQIADRMIIMYAGKIVEFAPVESLLEKPLHPYTQGLFNSVLTPEPEVKKRGITTIPGAPPNLINPPSGCRFHPRCPHAMDVCKEKEPPLTEIEPGRRVACWLYMEERA